MIGDNSSNYLRTSGKNISYWIDSTEPIFYEKLNRNINAEVVIIGGGISGITTAYLLSKEKVNVALIEDGFIGSGETGRTTAHIVNVLDDRYFDLEKTFNEKDAALAAESHSQAINFIDKIVKEEKIDCDFQRLDGYLFLHHTDKEENLQKEFSAASKAGLKVSFAEQVPGIKSVHTPALKFPNQAQFHPLKYMRSLCRKIIEQGGKIFTQTHADEISGKVIKASGGFQINAGNIVVATNTPISTRFVIHTKQFPYRTYVIACKIPKGTLPKALWWDTGEHCSEWFTLPYHYVRLQDYNTNYDLLIAGGEDHKTGQADKEEIPEDERYKNLYDWTKEHFPDAGEVHYHWSGQVIEPMDSLAFIGKDPTAENVYLVTGDSGNGITHGTLAGIILKDLILGRKNKFSALYDPSRKNLSSAFIYIKEQLNVAAQYADLFSKGDVENLKDLLSGNGAVIRYQLNKIAVYRDETGKYNFFSAICPHLKCVVQWNKDEKTFDCPCHGSRFSCYGKVINGPANKDLEVFESEKIKEDRT